MENFLELAAHYAIPFILVITIVVFVHEFGHYWVARLCGIKIEVFSIGFGNEIFGWTDKHGTRWKVSWLPLGGYVKMFGDASVASTPDASVQDMTDEQKRVSFFHQHVDKRMAVIVAGPLANYLFAIFVLALLFMFHGQPYTPSDVGEVTKDGVAITAGLKTGDHVTVIDGQTINSFEDIRRIIGLNTGTPITMQVVRDGKPLDFNLTPKVVTITDNFGDEHKQGLVGIKSSGKTDFVQREPLDAVKRAVQDTWNLSADTLRAVGQMLMGVRGTEDVGGPLRIAQVFSNTFKDGLPTFFWRIALISVNLGLVNLFPIPMLDGGHLAFYLAERLRGRPLSLRIQEIGANFGAAMVVALMLFATWNDLVHMKVVSFIRGLFS